MLLSEIPFIASPNCVPKALVNPSMIILHCPVGTMQSAIATFQNSRNQVSAHYVVGRDGTAVQMVHLTDVAWHAMQVPNHMAFGIEMQDIYNIGGQMTRGCMGDKQWFTMPELTTTASIVAQLMQKFNINLDKVMGHCDPYLKQFGNTHTDPGPYFPWLSFRNMVQNQLKLLAPAVQIAAVQIAPEPVANPAILTIETPQKQRKPRGRKLVGRRRKSRDA